MDKNKLVMAHIFFPLLGQGKVIFHIIWTISREDHWKDIKSSTMFSPLLTKSHLSSNDPLDLMDSSIEMHWDFFLARESETNHHETIVFPIKQTIVTEFRRNPMQVCTYRKCPVFCYRTGRLWILSSCCPCSVYLRVMTFAENRHLQLAKNK